MIQTVATHIELRPNRDGQPRAFIAGTRVRVQLSVRAMRDESGQITGFVGIAYDRSSGFNEYAGVPREFLTDKFVDISVD